MRINKIKSDTNTETEIKTITIGRFRGTDFSNTEDPSAS